MLCNTGAVGFDVAPLCAALPLAATPDSGDPSRLLELLALDVSAAPAPATRSLCFRSFRRFAPDFRLRALDSVLRCCSPVGPVVLDQGSRFKIRKRVLGMV